jgi:hypothetical protein
MTAERIDASVLMFVAGDGGRDRSPPDDGSYIAMLRPQSGNTVACRLVAGLAPLGAEASTKWQLIAPVELYDKPKEVVPSEHFAELVSGASFLIAEGIAVVGRGVVTRRYTEQGGNGAA